MKNRPSYETRNFPVDNSQYKSLVRTIKKALSVMTEEIIVYHINTYLDSCKQDKHIWDGKNVGYKTLDSFLKKVIKVETGLDTVWWTYSEKVVEDTNPELTSKIISTYGELILQTSNYSVSKTSKDYKNFVKAAEKVRKFARKNNFTEEEVIRYLFAAVEWNSNLYGEEMIYSGSLSSEFTWNNLILRYIRLNI